MSTSNNNHITDNSTAEQVKEWLELEEFDSSKFNKWEGLELFGATEQTIKNKLGEDEGERLYASLNGLKGISHTPKKSTASMNHIAFNRLEEKLLKRFKDFKDQDIKIYFPACNTNESYVYENKANITSFLNSLALSSFKQIIDIDDNKNNNQSIDFHADKLKYLTKSDYQYKILTPLSMQLNSNIIDTHETNRLAKFLCVSGVKDGSNITFSSKPDGVNKYSPLFYEVKSRRQRSIEVEDDISLPLNSINLSNITDIELDLFEQCMERIIVQSQFRAYLSKLVVLASSGHISWCFCYEQQFESETYRRVKVVRISNNDINYIWNGFSKRVEVDGCKFFLTNHGVAILSSLKNLTNINLHSIRVHLSNVSNAVVYYITLPSNESIVDSNIKTFAFKLMSNKINFINEITNLRKIKKLWNSSDSDIDRPFYYITDSDEKFQGLNLGYLILSILSAQNERYDWFKSLDTISYDIGVIIMFPALRKSDNDRDDNRLIFSQLLESLSIVHKAGILHCDIRPSNCLKFVDGWQVVDFDLAVPISISNGSGSCKLTIGTSQQVSTGYRIKEATKEYVNGSEVIVEWKVDDDIEMLNFACSHIYD